MVDDLLHEALQRRPRLEEIQRLVRENPARLRHKRWGKLPLHDAVSSCRRTPPEIIGYLVEEYPEALMVREDNYQANLPLHSYAGNIPIDVEILRMMVSLHPAALSVRNGYGRAPLHTVLLHGQPISAEAALMILSEHPDAATLKTNLGRLPLHSAAAQTTTPLSVLQKLVEAFPEAVNTTDPDGWLPFHFAAAYQHTCVVLEFLACRHPGGKDVALRVAEKKGWLPMHCAVRCGAPLPVVKWLAQGHPMAVSTPDKFGALPIHCMSRGETAHEAFECARVNARNSKQFWPDEISCIWTQPRSPITPRLVRLLLQHDPLALAKRDNLGRLPLHRACAGGATHQVVAILLGAYPEAVRTPRINGRLPLHDACFFSFPQSLPVVNFLIQKYPEAVSRPAFDGFLPLHDFCRGCHFRCDAVLEKLINLPETEGALMTSTNDGSLAIHVACGSSNPRKAVQLLIDKCPESVFVRDGESRLPLHRLCRNCPNLETAEALLKIHPDAARALDRHGKLPIHNLCLSDTNNPKTAKALLNHHPDGAKEFDGDGMLPLHRLCCSKFPRAETAQLLLEFHPGAAQSKQINDGQLPLHMICASAVAKRDVIETLLNANAAAIGVLDDAGRDPLVIACGNKCICQGNEIKLLEVLLMLVQAKVSVVGSVVG